MFADDIYGHWLHIGTILGSWSPSQESGMSSKVRKCSWWMQNLTFSILKIERSVIHQIVCILKDKSIGVLKITYGHHPPCIRKAISGTFLSRSTFVNFWATEKCDISICMYSVRQIQRCDQNHLWTSSFESGWSSLDQEGLLEDDQVYFCQFII